MLLDALIFLAAAVICVPLAKRAGLGAVLGYLIAGLAIGPWGLGLVTDPKSIFAFAEFGVVLMLFVIGLELDLRQVMQMRGPVFVGGGVQMGACGAVLAGGLMLLGLPWQAALVAGLALAISSTAIAVQTMSERNLVTAPIGRKVLAVSIFQDISAIPLMALVPALGAGVAVAQAAPGDGWLAAGKAVAAIAAVFVIGRYVTPPLMRLIARSDVREIFTALALLLVIGISELMQLAGLSMALGAFLAGVLLASSEYRPALQADIEPFRGLLLGLFFIAVGMSIDLGVVAGSPGLLALLVLGLLGLKAAVLVAIAPVLGVVPRERWLLAALLAPGSEFAFVVFGVAREAQVLPGAWEPLLTAAVVLSMAAAPLLALAHDRWQTRAARAQRREADAIDDATAPVIIAGFGRYGQIVGRLLIAQGIRCTVLDHDPEQIDLVRRFGFKVFYGDATRRDLLDAAGAAQAKLIVVAIDDVADSLQLVDTVSRHYPNLAIVARARNVRHVMELVDRGVTAVQRETFDSALRSGREALQALGASPHEARDLAEAFRRHNLATLAAMQPHFRDEERSVSIVKSGREELEENLRRDREAQQRSGDWQ
ncbi:MAG: glutathione-regulated potassium-efflux system protein KefC [Burkholderiaceae bacterium]|nr:glutathione-regulated potassium-efflux system protein KefC [Burkholderiaceae bacterium]